MFSITVVVYILIRFYGYFLLIDQIYLYLLESLPFSGRLSNHHTYFLGPCGHLRHLRNFEDVMHCIVHHVVETREPVVLQILLYSSVYVGPGVCCSRYLVLSGKAKLQQEIIDPRGHTRCCMRRWQHDCPRAHTKIFPVFIIGM